MSNNTNPDNKAPNPGTKDALKAENDALKAKVEALMAQAEKDAAALAELEKLKAANTSVQGAKEGAQTPVLPKTEERVILNIPRGASNEEPNILISVNGVNYLLPRGKASEVPAHIAAEYHRSVKAQEFLDRSRDKLLSAAKQ